MLISLPQIIVKLPLLTSRLLFSPRYGPSQARLLLTLPLLQHLPVSASSFRQLFPLPSPLSLDALLADRRQVTEVQQMPLPDREGLARSPHRVKVLRQPALRLPLRLQGIESPILRLPSAGIVTPIELLPLRRRTHIVELPHVKIVRLLLLTDRQSPFRLPLRLVPPLRLTLTVTPLTRRASTEAVPPILSSAAPTNRGDLPSELS